MSISEHDETGENIKRHPDTEPRVVVPKEMLNGTIATRIELIRRSIVFLAKDTMIKYAEEHNHVV